MRVALFGCWLLTGSWLIVLILTPFPHLVVQDDKEAESKGQESNREEKECLEECPKNLDISKNLVSYITHLHKHGEKLVKLFKAWVFGKN